MTSCFPNYKILRPERSRAFDRCAAKSKDNVAQEDFVLISLTIRLRSDNPSASLSANFKPYPPSGGVPVGVAVGVDVGVEVGVTSGVLVGVGGMVAVGVTTPETK